jgi:signal peptidase I
MTPGDVVYYRDKTGAHFGHLVERGYKWARVRHGDTTRRVPVADVKPWPPVYDAAPTRPVKRGRA